MQLMIMAPFLSESQVPSRSSLLTRLSNDDSWVAAIPATSDVTVQPPPSSRPHFVSIRPASAQLRMTSGAQYQPLAFACKLVLVRVRVKYGAAAPPPLGLQQARHEHVSLNAQSCAKTNHARPSRVVSPHLIRCCVAPSNVARVLETSGDGHHDELPELIYAHDSTRIRLSLHRSPNVLGPLFAWFCNSAS
ncbi:hypothetical protein LI328DRAFT_165215 [Trichoderma asperelloides]|nr:hypothetical protein LI328DRAFT_165215 [Trichoderma asperelloides]